MALVLYPSNAAQIFAGERNLDEAASFTIRIQVHLVNLNIPLSTRPPPNFFPKLPPSLSIMREALKRVADPGALGLHQRLDQSRLLETRVTAHYQSTWAIEIKQREENVADELERIFAREQVQKVAAVDDRQLSQQFRVGEERRGGARGIERVGLDESGFEATSVAEEIVAEIPEQALDISGVKILCRCAVRSQAPQVLSEEGSKVNQTLSGLDALQDLWVYAQLRDAEVEECEHPDARESVLCPRLVSL